MEKRGMKERKQGRKESGEEKKAGRKRKRGRKGSGEEKKTEADSVLMPVDVVGIVDLCFIQIISSEVHLISASFFPIGI